MTETAEKHLFFSAVFFFTTTGNDKMIEKLNTPWLERGETLVCLGDSLTESPQGYVSMLEAELAPRGIHVINAGLGGDKTPQALTRLVSDVIDRKPDAVSILFGANDSVIGRGCWRDEPVVEPITYRDNLVWMVHLCRLKGIIRKFSIAAPTGHLEGDALLDFGDIVRDYCLMARQAADLADAVFVPLDVALDRRREAMSATPDGLKLTVDGLHLTADGYRLMADTMLKTWCMK